ncbi:hypothetical protein ACH4VM_37600, partial [Streptomyces sp. NPDC020792]|uniref:hypothetical protein n=1 Tax=Streptomyces sp. NPDC020792 TaxID=3365089 RepID=UPI0037879DBE
LEQLPQLIRHQPLNNPHHGRQPTQPNEMTSKAVGEAWASLLGVTILACWHAFMDRRLLPAEGSASAVPVSAAGRCW